MHNTKTDFNRSFTFTALYKLLLVRRYLLIVPVLLLLLPAASAANLRQQSPKIAAIDTTSTQVQPPSKKEQRQLRRAERIYNRRYLAALLKEEKAAKDTGTHHSRRFYYGLAVTFTRLRLYPLAMKCYFKTLVNDDSYDKPQNMSPVTASLYDRQLPADRFDNLEDSLVNKQSIRNTHVLDFHSSDISLISNASSVSNGDDDIKSSPVSTKKITDPFLDGKTAVAYALMIHVKQPVSGKRKIFVLNNVGHTFITLIKYNSDSSVVCRSFGFYPKKSFILEATPLFPSAPSVFKDDSLHNWDEVSGSFISKKSFLRILAVVNKYDHKKYHLSSQNCTDFGLEVAAQAGIKIDNSKGKWPLGSGNNPACAGQSMREGKIEVAAGNPAGTLLMVNDTLVVKP